MALLFCPLEAELPSKTEKSLRNMVPIHIYILIFSKALFLITYVEWFSVLSLVLLLQTSWFKHAWFFLPKFASTSLLLDDFLAREVFSGQEVIKQSPLLPYVCPVLQLGLLLLFNLTLLYFVTFLVLAPSLFWIYITWEQISPLIKQGAWETLGIPFMFTEYATPCIKYQTIRWLFEDSVLWNSFPPR